LICFSLNVLSLFSLSLSLSLSLIHTHTHTDTHTHTHTPHTPQIKLTGPVPTSQKQWWEPGGRDSLKNVAWSLTKGAESQRSWGPLQIAPWPHFPDGKPLLVQCRDIISRLTATRAGEGAGLWASKASR
jgi:hypothetical protein